jgi:hypothetical protein
MILCRGQVSGRSEGVQSVEVVTFGGSLQAGCATIGLQVDYFGAEHLHASGAETPGPGAPAGAIGGRFDPPTPKPRILLDMTHHFWCP